jgi:hypothetical protein
MAKHNRHRRTARTGTRVDHLPGLASALLDEVGIDIEVDRSSDSIRVENLGLTEMMLDTLGRSVGGAVALRELDTEVLPDEDFDWTAVPEQIAEKVGQVLMSCDRCCRDLFGPESRTAVRRLLARLAADHPGLFGPESEPDELAVSLCWVIGEANDLFVSGRPTIEDVARYLAVPRADEATRARSVLAALGLSHHQRCGLDLGRAELLVSSRRREIARRRDAYLEAS